MYQILLGNNIFYDVRDKDLIVENPKLDLEINKVGTLSFKVYPSHPSFNSIENKVSKFTVKKDNRTIFKGRMVEEEAGIYNSKNILVESDLAYLNDSVVRPYTFSGTAAEHFTNLINNHNSQVAEYQKFKIGTITVVDPNNYIIRSSVNYENTWKVLNEDLIDKLGGYLRIRYEDDGTYIDYLEDFDDTSTQEIELGSNLIDVLIKNDAAEVYTVVIPLGAETEKEDGTKERLTIKSVNNGLDYLVNQTAFDKYGWIVAPVENTTWDDVTVASNLKTKGQTYLDNTAVMLKSSLDVSAIDLNVTDKEIEAFFIYEYIRFVSKTLNVNKIYLLNKISIPLDDPKNLKVTLGEETSSLTGIQIGNKNNIDYISNRIDVIENEKLNDLENAVKYFSVDLSQYNLTIPTDSTKKPLETKNYDISFYGYFKGKQITPTVTITGSNTGITVSKTNTYIRFAVNTSAAISNALNEYTITFTYTEDSASYEVTKVVDIALAIKGTDGTGGQPGKDGQDGKSAYQIWLDEGNTGTEEDYLNSLKGQDGTDGKDGKDGVSTYTHIKYSANSDGSNYTNNPASNTKYMGIAVTNSQTAPIDKSSYVWSEIKGADGTNGTNGTNGKDGVTYYTWIKYADTPTSGMSNTPDNKKYMGIASNKTTSTESSNYGDYAWSLIKGTDGANGQDGSDGVSSYIHVRYSANSSGNPMTTTPDSNTQYLGTATTNSSTAPTSYTAYTWVKTKGEQGIQGATGKDGTSYYFYVRYSANSNGNPMTTAPTETTKYMGVSSTTSTTAPTSYSAYTWTLIKGNDGANGKDGTNGSPGQPGADGKSSYLHIKYSDDGTTFTANSGETVGRYRGELVDNTLEDSTTFSDYTWYDMALIVDEELKGIREEFENSITSIQKDNEQIMMEALRDYVSVDEFGTFKETVSTNYTQTADDFTFDFNKVTERVTEFEGITQREFEEIKKYIRFVDGKVIIGEVGNEYTLVQKNDRISFMQNNTEVAYISNTKMVVTDGDFLNSLKIGNFAWKPRANGNLSLVYVGGETVG